MGPHQGRVEGEEKAVKQFAGTRPQWGWKQPSASGRAAALLVAAQGQDEVGIKVQLWNCLMSLPVKEEVCLAISTRVSPKLFRDTGI